MNIRSLIASLSLLLLAVSPAAWAKSDENYSTPIQLAFYAPLQLAPVDSDVYGVRFNLPYGVNRNIYGVDFGFWNVTTGEQFGVQLGCLVASRGGKAYGWNLAGIANFSSGNDFGVSFGGIYNQADGKVTGLQFASCVSKATKVVGVQFALITYCEDLTGVQVGLLNICPKSSVPFMFLINGKF